MRSSGTMAGTTTELTPSGDPAVSIQKKHSLRGLFWIFKSTLFNTASSASPQIHCARECWNRTRDRCDFSIDKSDALTTRLLIHSPDRSHPQLGYMSFTRIIQYVQYSKTIINCFEVLYKSCKNVNRSFVSSEYPFALCSLGSLSGSFLCAPDLLRGIPVVFALS